MSNRSKYFFSTFISFLFFSNIIFSQTSDDPANEGFIYPDSLDGKYALQFQIGSDFNLFDFQGTTFSGKYHVGKREALRLGVSLGFSDGSSDRDETFYDLDSTSQSDIEDNSFSIDLRMQYIRYFLSTSDVAFYGGIGPFIDYLKAEQTIKQTPPSDYPIERSIKDVRAGLDLLMGVEWMFSSNMSLSAEYGLLLYYNSFDETYTYTYQPIKVVTSSNSFRINSDQVKFGISVYF